MDQHFDKTLAAAAGVGVSVHAGFPNAADRPEHKTGAGSRALDFNALLVQNPSSTFCFRVRGSTHEARGIFDGDIAVIDRSLQPRSGDLIIWSSPSRGGDFVLSVYKTPQHATQERLEDLQLWGVITAVIHSFRPNRTSRANRNRK